MSLEKQKYVDHEVTKTMFLNNMDFYEDVRDGGLTSDFLNDGSKSGSGVRCGSSTLGTRDVKNAWNFLSTFS